MNDNNEAIEMTDQDLEDLRVLQEEPEAERHTLLEVWRELLKPAATEAQKPVTAGWASAITQLYPKIDFADMPEFHIRYYDKIGQLLKILLAEIETDDQCLERRDRVDDLEGNGVHYKNLIFLWKSQIMQWELDWSTTDPFAAVELGTISEVDKMFFSAKGIVAHFDDIGFQFTEDDQAELTDVLNGLSEGR